MSVVFVLCGSRFRKCFMCVGLKCNDGGNCYSSGLSLFFSVNSFWVKKFVYVIVVVLL